MEVPRNKNVVAHLLNPRNVALVGASDRAGHWSERVFGNLVRFGFAGRVFPVNPNRATIWGTTCFPTLAALPEPPDHLAIFTPAETTLKLLADGAASGARSATIYAAGFGEGGDAGGLRLAAELADILARTDLTAVGPNCMGVANGKSGFATIPDETLQPLAPGPVAVISQSGAMCASINRAIHELGLAVAYLVSCGNQIGCKVSDFIDYFADQPELRVIFCYIEAVPDAARFLTAARRARDNGKQVVAIKIGSSEAARASALAHTGSLAGRAEIFDVYAGAAGIIRLDSIEDGIEAIEFLARKPLPRGRNVAVVTNSGALRNLIIEASERVGLPLAGLADATRQALHRILDQADVGNPLDTKRTIPAAQYIACLDALVDAPEIDVVLAAEELPREEGIERRIANLRGLEAVAQRAADKGKAVAMFNPLLVGASDYGRRVRAQLPHVAVMRETEKTLRVMRALTEAGARPLHRGDFFQPPADTETTRSWRARLADVGTPAALNEVDSKALLRAYGIQGPPERLVQSAAEAASFAREIGFPVVLKAVSAAVPHKSDAGLVLLGLADAGALHDAYALVASRCTALGAPLEGVLVAKQINDGLETVLGIVHDPEMGPAVMFGMGGVWIELFKDVAFAPASLDREQASAMIRATRAGRLLEGFRGGKMRDCQALKDALVNLGRLARDLGDVIEAVDINPFIVCDRGAFALDGLIVKRSKAS